MSRGTLWRDSCFRICFYVRIAGILGSCPIAAELETVLWPSRPPDLLRSSPASGSCAVAAGTGEQTIRVSLRHAALPPEDKNGHQDIALPLEPARHVAAAHLAAHTHIMNLGVTADCSFEPPGLARAGENLAAVAVTTGAPGDR